MVVTVATNQASLVNLQTNNFQINQLQSNVQQALQPFINNPILYGTILSGIQLSVGSNTIVTGLGRACQGWYVVLISAASEIFDSQATNPNTQNLILNSSAKTTVSIYVF
jgi:hypothetical protein